MVTLTEIRDDGDGQSAMRKRAQREDEARKSTFPAWRNRMKTSHIVVATYLVFSLILGIEQWHVLKAHASNEVKAPYSAMAPLEQYLMDRDAEIALARSAAPDSISHDATVMVLGTQGFEIGAEGKNGFVCIVERAWTSPFADAEFWNSRKRGAICYNPQAARTILPITYMRTKLALAGKSKDEIKEAMKAAVEKKELPALEPGAMCYMMAKQAYLTDQGITQDGAHNMAHMMFYTPKINPAEWGANMDKSPIVIDPRAKNDPEPINTFMMLTGTWSDGSPAPLS
jgi:hypothetical protein